MPSGESSRETDGNSTTGETVYIVKQGDTLNKIAAQYGVTVNAIAYINNIQNVNLIDVGQRLLIPTDRNDLGHVLYKVKRGDTLTMISEKYGISIAEIVDLNGIQNPNLIYVGEILRI